jgi:hypothetical protein
MESPPAENASSKDPPVVPFIRKSEGPPPARPYAYVYFSQNFGIFRRAGFLSDKFFAGKIREYCLPWAGLLAGAPGWRGAPPWLTRLGEVPTNGAGYRVVAAAKPF